MFTAIPIDQNSPPYKDTSFSNTDFQFISTGNASPTGLMANESGLLQRKNISSASSLFDSKSYSWMFEVENEANDDFGTKPLMQELDIDLKDIYNKIRCVICPLPQFGFDRKIIRESPDFWGPLLVVVLYIVVSLYGQFRVVSWIVTIWLGGSMYVFVLARVLGAEVNFSQCIGVVGYSLLPLVIISPILPLVYSWNIIAFFVKTFGIVWSTYSAGSLLCDENLQHKKPLLLYPIFLLYIYFFSLHTGV